MKQLRVGQNEQYRIHISVQVTHSKLTAAVVTSTLGAAVVSAEVVSLGSLESVTVSFIVELLSGSAIVSSAVVLLATKDKMWHFEKLRFCHISVPSTFDMNQHLYHRKIRFNCCNRDLKNYEYPSINSLSRRGSVLILKNCS